MKAALDAQYRSGRGRAACVVFDRWEDGAPQAIVKAETTIRAPYRTGRFYERELPCLLAVLERAGRCFEIIVVDGYVHLKAETGKGLGRHLHEALGRRIPVIGVAKTSLSIADRFIPILRGRSCRPLFISAVGYPLRLAAEDIARMHGPYRLPTLLRLADQQARRGPIDDSRA